MKRLRLGVLLLGLAASLGLWQWSRTWPVPAPERGEAHLPRLTLAGTLPLHLTRIAGDFVQPTDLQWLPGQEAWLVLEKTGKAWWLAADGQTRGPLLEAKVVAAGEEGLLGAALHPQFQQNGRFFLNYVVQRPGPGGKMQDWTRIAEWHLTGPVRTGRATETQIVLEVLQPYSNHKAGQLQFGGDGKLYVGLGDGGAGGDPHDNGQNRMELLGKMLRIDVDRKDPGLNYAIPADNPFVGQVGVRGEIWALGLRNPWRYSFDESGRLIVADVGQNLWEEVDIVTAGRNLGWRQREGRHCFSPASGCATTGMLDPVFEYSHAEGQSITGGYVARGDRVPAIKGRFVVADFVSGGVWALDLPPSPSGTAAAWSLGRFSQHIATFGRDGHGDLVAADVYSGEILRLEP